MLDVQRATAAAPPPSGPLVTLLDPVRLYDSRSDAVPLGGAKLAAGGSVIVTVSEPNENRSVLAVFVNVTITQTEQAPGLFVWTGADFVR